MYKMMQSKRVVKFFWILLPVFLLTFFCGAQSPVYAKTCKNWVTIADECGTNCYQHGSYCDISQCYQSPPNYLSAETRQFWRIWEAWIITELHEKIIRNGVDCGTCTKRTEELQCPTNVIPRKVTSFSAGPDKIIPGQPTTLSWAASGCILDATIEIDNKLFSFKDVSTGKAIWDGTDGDYNIIEPKTYKATLTPFLVTAVGLIQRQ